MFVFTKSINPVFALYQQKSKFSGGLRACFSTESDDLFASSNYQSYGEVVYYGDGVA